MSEQPGASGSANNDEEKNEREARRKTKRKD